MCLCVSVCVCVQHSESKEEGLTHANIKSELGLSLISFALSRPLHLMIAIHSLSKKTFFSSAFNRIASLYITVNL